MTIIFLSISAIGQVAAVIYTQRLLTLVGRPKAGVLVAAGLALLVLRTFFTLEYNTVPYEQHQSAIIAELMIMLFSLSLAVGLYYLRIHARTRALSRLKPQPPPAPTGHATSSSTQEAATSLDDAGDPQIICNSDMEIVDLNQGAARLLGRERDELFGKSITSLVRKEEMLLVPDLFRQAQANETEGSEWSFRKPDESLVPVRISARSHFGDQTRLIIHDITDEREAQQAAVDLGRSTAIISKLLDASSEAYVAYDQDLKIVAWNARMEQITGVLRAQCMNQHLLMHFPIPEELAEEDYFTETLEGHSNELCNATLIDPQTGVEATFDYHFAPLLNDSEEIIGGMVVIRQQLASSAAAEPDSPSQAGGEEAAMEAPEEPQAITFKPELEPVEPAPVAEPAGPTAEFNAAPADAALLVNIFGTAPHTISVYDLTERKHIFENRTLPSQLGFSEEMTEAMGEDYLSEIVHPDDHANLPRTAEAWNDGSNIEQRLTEFRAIDPERNWHWYLATDQVLDRDADGKIRSIVSIIQDISAQKEEERLLRLGEQKYRSFSEHCPTGIWHLTAGGNTHYLNPAMRRILGIESADDISGRSYHEFITPDSQLKIATHEFDPEAGQPATIEVDIQRSDGSVRHCILNGIPDLDEAGQIRNLMGSFMDLTDQLTAEKALQASEERANRAIEGTTDGIWDCNSNPTKSTTHHASRNC